jgi:hypothetical protein
MDQREYRRANRGAADALAYVARIAPLSQMDWCELGYGLPSPSSLLKLSRGSNEGA